MGNDDNGCCVFPLTSLQVGDLQSYLSHLSLFLATESNKFYILVDNRPWLEGLGSRPAHLWQLMVTKSRLSPFANNRARKGKKAGKEKIEKKADNRGTNYSKCAKSTKSKFSERWFTLIDAATLSQKRSLLPVKKLKNSLQLNHKLHRTLFGLIIFEVVWADIRGMNYLNELQTDTSMALESKFMRRWEFDSIMEAVDSMSSWFSGTDHEQNVLRDYLLATVDDIFFDAEEDFSDEETLCFYDAVVENDSSFGAPIDLSVSLEEAVEDDVKILRTPPPPNEPYKRRKVTRSDNTRTEFGTFSETPRTPPKGIVNPLNHNAINIESTEYKDVLLLFRFNDRDLPYKLRDIVMSDLRLLTLLESGLPSWVIFLQSYPVFCHVYRPWMCPLARALYVVISVATVVIGFYDLYKNVPLLKATASHLFGPLFDWIETWEMVSRVKYLGTMLFLHNFEKAVKWMLMITRTTKSFFSVLAQPILEPLMEFSNLFGPFWTLCIQMAENSFSVIWIMLGSTCSFLGNMIEIVVLPIWWILSIIWMAAMSIILPILWAFWEILYAPVRLILALTSSIAYLCTLVYEMLGEVWSSVCSLFSIASATERTVTTYEASMWRSLWNDLFSKVFRAVRSILNGFVAFFAACNRHRLSIYNHIKELIQKLSGEPYRSEHIDPPHRKRHVGSHHPTPMSKTPKLVKSVDKQM
ncbi:uncharacterized protein LOC141622254 [Silene latifolia]|uniref:uncharacterized protein LOC141622254 n=1 Tax=Silene latifolia TaxID=37657 RepID=UPI003D78304A